MSQDYIRVDKKVNVNSRQVRFLRVIDNFSLSLFGLTKEKKGVWPSDETTFHLVVEQPGGVKGPRFVN